MDYIEVSFSVSPKDPATEILIAELGELNYEMFQETESGVLAYVPADLFSLDNLNSIELMNNDLALISFEYKLIQDQNWNSEWEKNFQPIIVDDTCVVRAPFHHLDKEYLFDLIVEPKMSFGTGHHETTFLMLSHILTLNISDMKVLDMGCGTAVLAILAAKKQAKAILAIDIDEWAVENSLENITRNNITNVKVIKGDAQLLDNESDYDLVFANINRNILLKDIAKYHAVMKKNAFLLLSGFFVTDINSLLEASSSLGFDLQNSLEKNNWAMLCLKKQ
jgi:ribosomal protein L11 methyltransferase